MEKKLRVGILGGTGMVGQRFISLLENHPWLKWYVLQPVQDRRERLMRKQLEIVGR